LSCNDKKGTEGAAKTNTKLAPRREPSRIGQVVSLSLNKIRKEERMNIFVFAGEQLYFFIILLFANWGPARPRSFRKTDERILKEAEGI